MLTLSRVCVFCGSSPGARVEYAEAARAMGRTLAERGIGLVYGGGSVGLMGEVAGAALAAGGEVIGIIPEHMAGREVAYTDLPDLRVVGSMHERKALMYDLADGFVALPGGIGTLEELFEVWTWAQLGLAVKPAGLLEVAGFYSRLVAFLDHACNEGFLKPQYRDLLVVADDPTGLLGALAAFDPPPLPRWLLADER